MADASLRQDFDAITSKLASLRSGGGAASDEINDIEFIIKRIRDNALGLKAPVTRQTVSKLSAEACLLNSHPFDAS